MIMSGPKERRKQDKAITTAQLQIVLQRWFLHVGSRDISQQFAKLANDQPENGAACPEAMADAHKFFLFLFEVVKNGVLLGQKMELAVQNEHSTSSAHTTKKDIIKVSEKFTNVCLKACKRYRELCDDQKSLSKFLTKARFVIACVSLSYIIYSFLYMVASRT